MQSPCLIPAIYSSRKDLQFLPVYLKPDISLDKNVIENEILAYICSHVYLFNIEGSIKTMKASQLMSSRVIQVLGLLILHISVNDCSLLGNFFHIYSFSVTRNSKSLHGTCIQLNTSECCKFC